MTNSFQNLLLLLFFVLQAKAAMGLTTSQDVRDLGSCFFLLFSFRFRFQKRQQLTASFLISYNSKAQFAVKYWKLTEKQLKRTRVGILGHQFDKILESFAPGYSQSLLLVDFKENRGLLWFFK